ncbi:hypothetical protein [Massilia horti]|uniref:Lipoprotein n=1 Tax=Massilia horti TaxID=2562153 RepID=A0A4Y9T4J3_9BURK|nr:hypothetical protein [Massilia horti]TFW32569.1 hypothetical protein E4O92_09405 [Massilia horti]
MNSTSIVMRIAAAALLLAAAGCQKHAESVSGVIQTKFPGQVSAGGGTSGQVLARNAKPTVEGTYAGGTPGIAGGAGGNTAGAATAGNVQESGQGPSQGTTQPASVGQAGAQLPPGEHATPAAPPPNLTGGAASHQGPASPAAPGTLKGK